MERWVDNKEEVEEARGEKREEESNVEEEPIDNETVTALRIIENIDTADYQYFKH